MPPLHPVVVQVVAPVESAHEPAAQAVQAVAPVVAMKELRAQGVQVVLPSTAKDPATHGTGSAICPAHELPARHGTPAAVEHDAGQKLPGAALQGEHEPAFVVSL